MSADAFSWDMGGYVARYPFQSGLDGLTMREVQRVFQLEPAPPEKASINDYILDALRERDLKHFTFFLHQYEQRLNNRISGFLIHEGLDRYDPERFLDYKMGCVLALLDCLPGYDETMGADFLTYAHHFIGNAILTCRMQEEAGSFGSLDEYKNARGIAWLYSGARSAAEAVKQYADKTGCAERTAEKYLDIARRNRSRIPFYVSAQDEDGEETGEDVTRDDSWDYAAILTNNVRAAEVRDAFEKLSYREQTLLEKRNAICMTCGRVSPLQDRPSFEELAVMFEGSGASGAERAYRRALKKLTKILVEAGSIHAVELERRSQKKVHKKISAAVYAYRVDFDGDWGELQFDFEGGNAEIVTLTDWDTVKTNRFAKLAISRILRDAESGLPKKLLLAVERDG